MRGRDPLRVMLSEGPRRPSVMCVEVALTKALFLLWFYEGAYGSSVLTAFWDLLAQRVLSLDFFHATLSNTKYRVSISLGV